MRFALVAIIAVAASANEYASLGQGQCVDSAGQEVSYYITEGWVFKRQNSCQLVCDADDECVAFLASDYTAEGICVLYAPSRSSAPDYNPDQAWWAHDWRDLSHDSVTKAWHNPDVYYDQQDCMLKKAATAHVMVTDSRGRAAVQATSDIVVTAELSSSSAVGNYLAKWVKSQDGTYVTSKAQGTHNCWDLAMAALEHARSAGYGPLRIKSSYVWSSQKVSYQNAQPGDIMQFSYYEELYQGYELWTDDHHTAVVTKAYSGGGIEVREQNPDKCGKSVYHPGSKTAGSVTIYRMSSSSEEDASEFLV